MKTIIAGSRSITDPAAVIAAVAESGFQITEVVSGAAHGVDRLGEEWARRHEIPIVQFPPDWNKYGRGAGVIRNNEMAAYAEALVAIWDGSSHGTYHMVNAARERGLKVFVYRAGKTLRKGARDGR